MTEEQRLSAVIGNVNAMCALGPKDAYFVDHKKRMQRNPLFSGMSNTESMQLSNYLHIHPQSDSSNSSSNGVGASADKPEGCWSVKKEATGRLTLVQSLHWPGYCVFNAPLSGMYGQLYIGTGKQNLDIGFML